MAGFLSVLFFKIKIRLVSGSLICGYLMACVCVLRNRPKKNQKKNVRFDRAAAAARIPAMRWCFCVCGTAATRAARGRWPDEEPSPINLQGDLRWYDVQLLSVIFLRGTMQARRPRRRPNRQKKIRNSLLHLSAFSAPTSEVEPQRPSMRHRW